MSANKLKRCIIKGIEEPKTKPFLCQQSIPTKKYTAHVHEALNSTVPPAKSPVVEAVVAARAIYFLVFQKNGCHFFYLIAQKR